MKRFKIFFRILAALVLTFLTVNVKAVPWATPALPGEGLIQPEATAASRTTAHFQREDPMAAVTISLLTCSPGTEIWSLYGHTALRVQDKKRGLDVAVNWGLFSYSQPYFIPRFVFGRCDYQMGMEPMDIFLAEYREEGRGVIEQELNLSSAEKQQIINALGMAYQPENRTYRYNFFYDNCTTRARDMVLKQVKEAIDWHEPKGVEVSWRDMVHDGTAVTDGPASVRICYSVSKPTQKLTFANANSCPIRSAPILPRHRSDGTGTCSPSFSRPTHCWRPVLRLQTVAYGTR